MCIRFLAVFLIVSSMRYDSSAQQTRCFINLSNQDRFSLDANIGLPTGKECVTPDELLTSIGIFTPCSFICAEDTFRLNISGFSYKLIRRGEVITSGRSNSAYFGNDFREMIQTSLNDDVLKIGDLQVSSFNCPCKTVDLGKAHFIDSFQFLICESVTTEIDKISKYATDAIFSIVELSRLLSLYDGHLSPDRNRAIGKLRYDANDLRIYYVEIELFDAGMTTYHWRFQYNILTKECSVFDMTFERTYSVEQWSKLVSDFH